MPKKRILTEEELREGFRAAALAHGDLYMQIHEAIRPLQEEAVEQWYDLQQWMEAQSEAINPQGVIQEEASQPPNMWTAARDVVESGMDFFKRILTVEPYREEALEMASPASPNREIPLYSAYLAELSLLNVRPRIIIDIRKEPKRSKVSFILGLVEHPESSDSHLKPKRSTIKVCLIRPTPKKAIPVKLGSFNAEVFNNFAETVLRDYSEGEETEWKVEVAVHPGATWEQSSDL